MKCVCFKLSGDYGHYRPYYTTSSPTTYSLMPPTSIYGLVGAILGLKKDDNYYYKELENAKIKVGIGLLTPVKKVTMSTNLVNTKMIIGFRQIKIQVVLELLQGLNML